MEKQFYSIADIAKLLDMTRQSVRAAIANGTIKAVKVNKTYRIPISQFKDYIKGE